MQSISEKLKLYKPPEKIDESKLLPFQDYVLGIIKEFGVVKPYSNRLWALGKNNRSFIEGKVAIVKERFAGQNLSDKGRYLTKLLKNEKAPWVK